jgi:hypothetical protein
MIIPLVHLRHSHHERDESAVRDLEQGDVKRVESEALDHERADWRDVNDQTL